MKVVTFKINDEFLQRLDLYCINNRKSRSEIIKEAITFYLHQKGVEK
ncbi:Transcriptional regulator, RHH [Saccharolobus shibatae B12]|uniref:Transcriptional regulator, RHH n=1 Tax=Saccharolobus shibatae (strain ATCC 51178 / DSM 5389 / JCM 8931 / NBRC 15437 / B12) TaxID=523848 RepID=A0A8F5BMH3_SACSH|nr:ribbon-helix-helix protein, CopG family [Saccharolobus shibatae]QXJ27821.1 Transcriptional regulator, RHH [Saccharolobus shibatae B12]